MERVTDSSSSVPHTSLVGVDTLHREGLLGRGVTIAIMDTGVVTREELNSASDSEPRIFAYYDAITDTQARRVDALLDDSGHGSHIVTIP